MRNARHNGGASRDDDKKFDFLSPDGRHSKPRSAMHRYLPAEVRGESARPAMAARAVVDEAFSGADFKPRWWPAPDAWR
ncbi:MAG TPA: hypothetical protein VH253_19225 [Phycisphaerae bacterium]|nr:hypothetical protein [Phycisphaerae bacterium]